MTANDLAARRAKPPCPAITVQDNGLIDFVHPDLVDADGKQVVLTFLPDDAEVLLDPPYAHDEREKRLYREDDAHLSAAVRAWALENGDNPQLRIALCGFDTEHGPHMPSTWRCIAWRSTSSAKTAAKERIWFSPHCLDVERQGELFVRAEVA